MSSNNNDIDITTNRAARRFGAGAFAALALVGAWLALRKHHPQAGVAVASAGALVLALSLAAPAAALRLRAGWMALGGALGWINSRIILTILFVLILTPIALIRRLGGGDPLGLRWKRGRSDSYWTPRTEAYDPKHYERPS